MRLTQSERMRRMDSENESVWVEAEAVTGPRLRHIYPTLLRAPIEVIVCPLGKAVNHGGILRAADSFRIERVTFQKEEDGATDFAGSRGAKKWQPYRWLPAIEAANEAKSGGRTLVSLTWTPDAISIFDFDWTFPLSIVAGSEWQGVPDEIVDMSDHVIAIPMFGATGSLNVAVATSIVLSQATMAYHRSNPSFIPARRESQKLLRLEGTDLVNVQDIV